jgi:hypothetical protein
MFTSDPLQSECLSLIASLYGAVADAVRFAGRRAECEAWLARQAAPDTPAASFLRLQVDRASEACALACRAAAAVPAACAVLTIDDRGRVIAAGVEAWPLLRSGTAGEDPLRLPLALRVFVEDTCLSRAVPKALRVPLDDGSSELAGVVLGVDQVKHAVGAMRVITLLLCDVGRREARPAQAAPRRADVREFRPAGGRPAAPYAVGLAADRSA